MLIQDGQFTFPDFSGVFVYPDDRRENAFYAIPQQTRIARDSGGKPEISLMVYGKGHGPSFVPTGAVFTLTVSLELTSDEENKLRSLLSAKLADAELVPVQWTAGEVELQVAGGLSLTQKPSMMGDNRCSFSSRLDASQAKALEEAWAQGSSGLHVAYDMQTATAREPTSRMEYTASTSVGGESYSSEHFARYQHSTGGGSAAMHIEGEIESDFDLASCLTRVEM